jgi:F-type H+-transporting ATPase subunit c
MTLKSVERRGRLLLMMIAAMFLLMAGAALAQGAAAAAAPASQGFLIPRFAVPLGLGLAALGSGIGLGRAVGSAMEAMGRQPEALARIQLAMIIGCAFIEALTIYAFITIFLI